MPLVRSLICRKVIREVGYLNTEYKYANDLEFLLRLAKNRRIEYLKQKVTVLFRIYSESSSQKKVLEIA